MKNLSGCALLPLSSFGGNTSKNNRHCQNTLKYQIEIQYLFSTGKLYNSFLIVNLSLDFIPTYQLFHKISQAYSI